MQRLIERYNLLPSHLQKQVIEFVDFLTDKYVSKTLNELNEPEQNKLKTDGDISEELKAYLDERIVDLKNNPDSLITWKECEKINSNLL